MLFAWWSELGFPTAKSFTLLSIVITVAKILQCKEELGNPSPVDNVTTNKGFIDEKT